MDNTYTHTDEWLTACLQWIQSNFTNISEGECQKQIFEQWIDANLEELGSSCLPLNLAGQRCCNLTGKFGLQMNYFEDIGDSEYNKWKEIKKFENENINVTDAGDTDNSWAPKKRNVYISP